MPDRSSKESYKTFSLFSNLIPADTGGSDCAHASGKHQISSRHYQADVAVDGDYSHVAAVGCFAGNSFQTETELHLFAVKKYNLFLIKI